MRYRLRTLMILLAVLPPVLAVIWNLLPFVAAVIAVVYLPWRFRWRLAW
jgi:hypothetical protein